MGIDTELGSTEEKRDWTVGEIYWIRQVSEVDRGNDSQEYNTNGRQLH